MQTDQPISEKQSLQIIEGMITSTRKDIADNGAFYLLWGYAVFVAALTHYYLFSINYELHFLPWPIIMPLAGVGSFIIGARMEKKVKMKTQLDVISQYVWAACFGGIALSIGFMNKIGFENFQALIVIFYSIGLFISGGMYRFRPLIIGGVLAFACGTAMLLVSYEYQLLLSALSILISYIIPGHLLQRKANRG